MDACKTIDKVLINIQGQINQVFDYKCYSHKAPSIRVEQFRLNVADFSRTLDKELYSLERIPYLIEQCTDLKESLENKLSKKSLIHIPQSFRNAQLAALKEIANHLNSFISDLSKEIANADSLADVKNEDIVLSSPQVALFILYLRDAKFISQKVSDSKVAEFFGKMTGYSPDQLRKTIAGMNRFERNQITHLESNYDNLKKFLGIIIDRIESDKRKAILKKDK
jgi:hypothetical protein